jgi:tetratricopeptide (TPR) repeat protein
MGAIQEESLAAPDGVVAQAVAEAKSLADIRDWDKAREALAKAIDASPNDPELHAQMAWYTYQCKAIVDFERDRLAQHHLGVALELDPENAKAHYYQGLMWEEQGTPVRARSAYMMAIKAQPDFAPAAKALDKLDKGGVEEPAPVQPGMASRAAMQRAPGARQRVMVLAGIMAAAAALGAVYFLAGGGEHDEIANQLGTKLKLISASRAGNDLHIDAGESWKKMEDGDRASEMQKIATRAQALGYVNVFVYSNSMGVGEVRDGKVCASEGCVVGPKIDTAKSTSESTTVNITNVPTQPAKPAAHTR